jgi:hypothetical protein
VLKSSGKTRPRERLLYKATVARRKEDREKLEKGMDSKILARLLTEKLYHVADSRTMKNKKFSGKQH